MAALPRGEAPPPHRSGRGAEGLSPSKYFAPTPAPAAPRATPTPTPTPATLTPTTPPRPSKYFAAGAATPPTMPPTMPRTATPTTPRTASTEAAAAATPSPSRPATTTPSTAPPTPSGLASRPKRVVVVGQAPGPEEAEEPLRGLAEKRLARLAGAASPAELWAVADKLNLLPRYPGKRRRLAHHTREGGYAKHASSGDAFPRREAAFFAGELDVPSLYDKAVLLGLAVARTFSVRRPVLLKRVQLGGGESACEALIMPHTSGVSHFWNDPAKVAAAATALRAFLDLPALLRERSREALGSGSSSGDGDAAPPAPPCDAFPDARPPPHATGRKRRAVKAEAPTLHQAKRILAGHSP